MLFNSINFLIFFTLTFLIYWRLSPNLKKPFLLLASLGFYAAWDWRFILLILLSSGTDYLCGKFIFAESEPRKKVKWILISLIVNLGILGFFKYFNFFLDSVHRVFPSLPLPILNIILPIGISFFTFQGLSYTIDIYRNELKPAKALDYFLFVAFFPQLLSGPIVRAKDFLPQLFNLEKFNWENVFEAALLFARGFGKKVFLSTVLANYCDPIFSNPSQYSALECLLGAYAFAFQIFFDFSGYTDMARGTALALGYKLPENFHFPYLATSPRDFWKRWHITLSTWLRDYLYKSLGGDRSGKMRTYQNLFLTMALGGLWHGANWTFFIWGCFHGLLLIIERWINPKKLYGLKNPFVQIIPAFITFNLICIGWIFFRSSDFKHAIAYLKTIISYSTNHSSSLVLIIVSICSLYFWQFFNQYFHKNYQGSKIYELIKIGMISAGVVLAFIFSTSNSPFIYFQF